MKDEKRGGACPSSNAWGGGRGRYLSEGMTKLSRLGRRVEGRGVL